MEELQPEDIEELVQELEQEYGERPLAPDVEQFLEELRPGNFFGARQKAVEQLGRVPSSHPRILRALIQLADSDTSVVIRTLAANALQAAVHQEILLEYPDLQRRCAEVCQELLEEHPELLKATDGAPRRRSAAARYNRRVPESILRLGGMVLAGLAIVWIGLYFLRTWAPVGGALIVAGTALAGWGLWIWLWPRSRRNKYRRSMRETTATVDEAIVLKEDVDYGWASDSDDFGHDRRVVRTHCLTVLFQVETGPGSSRTILLWARVAERIWKSTAAGNRKATVRYAAEDPRIALIEGEW